MEFIVKLAADWGLVSGTGVNRGSAVGVGVAAGGGVGVAPDVEAGARVQSGSGVGVGVSVAVSAGVGPALSALTPPARRNKNRNAIGIRTGRRIAGTSLRCRNSITEGQATRFCSPLCLR